MLETFLKTPEIIFPNSFGFEYPTVSGILTVVAPASIAFSSITYRYSGSDLEASIGENSISSTNSFALFTASTAIDIIDSLSFFI